MAAGGGAAAGWTAVAGLAGWAGMSVSFLPALRLYRLGWWRAPALPLVAGLYAVMTADSARRHYCRTWRRMEGPDRGPVARPERNKSSLRFSI